MGVRGVRSYEDPVWRRPGQRGRKACTSDATDTSIVSCTLASLPERRERKRQEMEEGERVVDRGGEKRRTPSCSSRQTDPSPSALAASKALHLPMALATIRNVARLSRTFVTLCTAACVGASIPEVPKGRNVGRGIWAFANVLPQIH